MRRFLALVAVLSIVACFPLEARRKLPQLSGGSGSGSPPLSFTATWQVFKLGAGGQISGMQSYSDGTILARTDTYGAYLYKTSGSCTYGATVYTAPCWQQVVNTSTLPATASGDGGVLGFVAAPSNTNILYMLWEGRFWISQDRGVTWTQITGVANTNSPNFTDKATNPWIAVDPNTASTVFVATTAGMAKVTNATTTPIVTAIASLPDRGAIAYEQGSSTHLLCAVYGGGVYESTNGSTFALTTSPPTIVGNPQLTADKFGQFWLADTADSTGSLYKFASSTWSTKSTSLNGSSTVITNPSSAALGSNQVIVMDFYGKLSISNDNGATWTAPTGTLTFSASGAQPTWLNNAFQSTPPYMSTFSLAFDPSQNLFIGGGIGIWQTSAPVVNVSTPWAANTLGVEQLVDIQILTPPGGSPISSVWDRGFFTSHNPDTFPSTYYLNSSSTGTPIVFGWSIDYASNDPTFLAGWEVDLNGVSRGASSTDGGNTFSAWASEPAITQRGGWIAALTSQKWLLLPEYNAGVFKYTADGGGTWTASTVTSSTWAGGPGVGIPFAADRVAANTYCAITTAKTVYYSTDAGINFSASGLTSADIDGNPNASMLRASPDSSNSASIYWYTAGPQDGSGTSHFWKITKATNPCDTATSAGTSMREVWAFGFGATKPGASLKTIYTYGVLSGTRQFAQSIDGGATWTSINVAAGQLNYALGSADFYPSVDGDPDVYGRINVGFRGSGGAYIDTQDACPFVNWTSTNPNASLTGTVTLTAQHSGLVPVTGVNFYVDGVQIGSTQTGQTSYSVSWNTGGVAPGAHTLKVQAAGNSCTIGGTGNSKSIPVTTH